MSEFLESVGPLIALMAWFWVYWSISKWEPPK